MEVVILAVLLHDMAECPVLLRFEAGGAQETDEMLFHTVRDLYRRLWRQLLRLR
jgi:hypothetical protein